MATSSRDARAVRPAPLVDSSQMSKEEKLKAVIDKINSLLLDNFIVEGRSAEVSLPNAEQRCQVTVTARFDIDCQENLFHEVWLKLLDIDSDLGGAGWSIRNADPGYSRPVAAPPAPTPEPKPWVDWTREQLTGWRKIAGIIVQHNEPEEYLDVGLYPPSKYHNEGVISLAGREYCAYQYQEVGDTLREFGEYFIAIADAVDESVKTLEAAKD